MSSLIRTIGTGVLVGALATLAKTKAEGLLQPRAEALFPPAPASKLLPGADGSDHPENMPPAEVVSKVVEVTTGAPAEDDLRLQGAQGVHWAMGVGSAVAYAALRERVPAVRAGFGTLAGLGLYAGTHGSSLPVMGLQPFPWRMPRSAIVWEAGSHLIYGAVVETGLRLIDELTATLSPPQKAVRRA